jgi:hypothetical protein
VLRSYTAVFATLALALTFVESPFLHTHQHESTQRHPGAFLHFHYHVKSIHPAGSEHEFRDLDPNDDAQLQNWFSATHADEGLTPVVLTESVCVDVPEGDEYTLDAPLQNGHDPPLLCTKGPRAPPA